MAVSILHPWTTFIQSTPHGNVFITNVFHNTHPGPVRALPLWAPMGPCELGP